VTLVSRSNLVISVLPKMVIIYSVKYVDSLLLQIGGLITNYEYICKQKEFKMFNSNDLAGAYNMLIFLLILLLVIVFSAGYGCHYLVSSYHVEVKVTGAK
jgi:hypothetical protein